MKKSVRIFEKTTELTLLLCALVSILSVIFISVFIFKEGLPLFQKVGFFDFLFGGDWSPTGNPPSYGIANFIIGSIAVTFLSLLFAMPIGIGVGIFLAEISGKRLASFCRAVVQLFAGIPSVIYGLFGYIAIAPIIRRFSSSTTGLGIFTAAIILALMILPTIINITEVSLLSVKRNLREASVALGATDWYTISRVVLPAAKTGIAAGAVLGMGRAVGETMAVLMVAGNSVSRPGGILDLTRTLTMNIATDMKYASGDHYTSLFTTGIVLFVFILVLNLASNFLINRSIRGEK
ncbi:MAG: phosphate ABC transporter permease subunit PstC [Spirochaetales bacterium]|nr:phosphate ABC transporter permease subunit PstC [Spirochaetales bacterium]